MTKGPDTFSPASSLHRQTGRPTSGTLHPHKVTTLSHASPTHTHRNTHAYLYRLHTTTQPTKPAAFAPWKFIPTRAYPSLSRVRRRRSATSSLWRLARSTPEPTSLRLFVLQKPPYCVAPRRVSISPDTATFCYSIFFCFSFYHVLRDYTQMGFVN